MTNLNKNSENRPNIYIFPRSIKNAALSIGKITSKYIDEKSDYDPKTESVFFHLTNDDIDHIHNLIMLQNSLISKI